MSMHFILGGAGTGKSTRLITRLIESAAKEPDRKHVILVPEQYTMQTQRNIIRMHPDHAVMNIDILSFERLAYRVLGEMGQDRRKVLTVMGKNMLLRRVCSEHEKELKVFGRSLRRPGFISRLMSIISEFYQYGITEEQLEQLQPRLADQPLLSRKMEDLRVFYRAMNQVKGESMAAEELLTLLDRLLLPSGYLEGAVVAIDCFTGFTPVQYQILEKMLKCCPRLEMALLLPEEEWREESREEDLFHISQDTVFRTMALARNQGLPVSREFCREDHRHSGQPELLHLAEHFLRNDATPRQGAATAITVVSRRNPREEAEYAASVIRALVMEGDLRYRDIAVVTGDIDGYRPFLENSFRHYEIPAFLDRKKGILGSPLVEYLRGAMAAVQQDMNYESVFRFLKCGIRIMEPEELDLLDNYCLARGIRGRKAWETEWSREQKGRRLSQAARELLREEDPELELLNELRLRVLHVLAPVLSTRNVFKQDEEGRSRIELKERTAVLRQLLQDTDVAEQMQALAEELEKAGETDLAREYAMTTDYVLELLDQMDQLLGEQCVSLTEFSDILDAGLAEARLGALPDVPDRVQVGDVMRSRLGEIRVLIVLGFNEGVIPGVSAGGGILSEAERVTLASADITLAPPAETVSNQERFYLYRLMTAPSRRIFLSFSQMGSDGTARRPSWILEALLRLYPGIRVREGDERSLIGKIVSREQSWQLVAGSLGALKEETDPGKEEDLLTLAQCLREDDRERCDAMVTAAFTPERSDSIGRKAAEILYGTDLSGSVSRLETYSACAYAHFLKYGLGLNRRDEGQFDKTRRGDFFHSTLEEFFRLCAEKELDAAALGEEQREQLVEEALESAAGQTGLSRMEKTFGDRYRITRWKKLAQLTVWAVCRMMAAEEFRPEACEIPFDGKSLPSMKLKLGDGRTMTLRGKVDRLDSLRTPGEKVLRVVDYKTYGAAVDVNEIYEGLQLQLPLYMKAMEERSSRLLPEVPVIPGGIFCYDLDEPFVEAEPDRPAEKVESALLNKLKMTGLRLDDPEHAAPMENVSGEALTLEQFRLMENHVMAKAEQFGREILAGRIAVDPYRRKENNACTWCEYRQICGFNDKRAGSEYRRIPGRDKDTVWRKMEEEGQCL